MKRHLLSLFLATATSLVLTFSSGCTDKSTKNAAPTKATASEALTHEDEAAKTQAKVRKILGLTPDEFQTLDGATFTPALLEALTKFQCPLLKKLTPAQIYSMSDSEQQGFTTTLLGWLDDAALQAIQGYNFSAPVLNALGKDPYRHVILARLAPPQIAQMSDEQQQQLTSTTMSWLSKDAFHEIRGVNLPLTKLDAMAADYFQRETLYSISGKQVDQMPDIVQQQISARILPYLNLCATQAIRGNNLTASILNSVSSRLDLRSTLEKFLSKQISLLPDDEQKRLAPETVAALSRSARQSLKGQNFTARLLNGIADLEAISMLSTHDRSFSVLGSITFAQLFAMPQDERKKIAPTTFAAMTQEQQRALNDRPLPSTKEVSARP